MKPTAKNIAQFEGLIAKTIKEMGHGTSRAARALAYLRVRYPHLTRGVPMHVVTPAQMGSHLRRTVDSTQAPKIAKHWELVRRLSPEARAKDEAGQKVMAALMGMAVQGKVSGPTTRAMVAASKAKKFAPFERQDFLATVKPIVEHPRVRLNVGVLPASEKTRLAYATHELKHVADMRRKPAQMSREMADTLEAQQDMPTLGSKFAAYRYSPHEFRAYNFQAKQAAGPLPEYLKLRSRYRWGERRKAAAKVERATRPYLLAAGTGGLAYGAYRRNRATA